MKKRKIRQTLSIYLPVYDTYTFRKRNTDLKFWFMIIVIMILLGFVGHQELQDIKLKQQIHQCQTQNTHVWIMDKSCSTQLLNATDGILIIKTR